MDLKTHSIKSLLECGCGGQLHKIGEGYGYIQFCCDCCGARLAIESYRKGGRLMPFPKDVKRPGDVPGIPMLHSINDFNGKDLMLKSTEIRHTEQYGDGLVLVCETEKGEEARIFTFSDVIKEQVAILHAHLPLIIRPVNNGTYYTIY